MHAQDTRKLLIVVRHPGPADFIAVALPTLCRYFAVTVLATDSAAMLLLSRHADRLVGAELFIPQELMEIPNTLLGTASPGGFIRVEQTARLTVCTPPAPFSATQLAADDLAGITHLRQRLEAFVMVLAPDVVLRTTPSHAIGVDEVAPAALRAIGFTGPILCLQDYYGIGIALRSHEHPIVEVGVDAIATIDQNAAQILAQRTSLTPTVIGWIAHDQYCDGPRYRFVRREARRMLRMTKTSRLVLYAGINSGLPDDNDLNDFVQVLSSFAVLQRGDAALRLACRPHPRCCPQETQRYHDLAARLVPPHILVDVRGLPTFRHTLAVSDLIVSPASAFNLDALAYLSMDANETGDSLDATVSLYTTGEYARRAIQHLTGLDLLPTHQVGSGNFVSSYEDLPTTITTALLNADIRRKVLGEAYRIYRPDGRTAERLVRFIQEHCG